VNIFESTLQKMPKPMQVEQLVLMLLVSSILMYQVKLDDNKKHQHPKIVAISISPVLAN
jgi:hypothetical protein